MVSVMRWSCSDLREGRGVRRGTESTLAKKMSILAGEIGKNMDGATSASGEVYSDWR